MTTHMSTTEEIIGRSEIDDFEAILSVVGIEEPDGIHVVHSDYDSNFTWDYEKAQRPKLEQALREGQGCSVERRDRSPLGDRSGPGETGAGTGRGDRRVRCRV